MPDSILIGLMIALSFVLAGWVKGVVGMGLPTTAMALLSLMLAPAEAAALLVVPSMVTNLWQLFAGPAFWPLLRRLGLMVVAICVGTALGISLLTASESHWPSFALGVVLAIYAVFGLVAPRLSVPARLQPVLSPLVGLVTGLFAGATGVLVFPVVPYLGALNLDKEELIQALGLSFTVSTIALGIALAMTGRYSTGVATTSLLAVLPALLGMLIGQRVRDRLDAAAFRRWFFYGMLVVGIVMVVRAAMRLAG
ncbi:hypothetical protein DFR24_1542 [Panacagrimonas perspica]|uniref:Probable membrane transporter protein n=1 Tax=Panacagrimonas perspica TaxID=381431 RepID=A0A4R7PDD0_9GAMM|nr:sulfite exporter TauE/SafE family protein [Panacagrimonas perspica]TDU32153.1 hypothetical protein DFR24_1542 [Panacagrimonas perspica]